MSKTPEAQIWSVFDKQERLVLALSDEPGEFNLARLPEDEGDPIECPFATLQCYDGQIEAQLLNELFRAGDLPTFLKRLQDLGFRVRPGRPRVSRFARL